MIRERIAKEVEKYVESRYKVKPNLEFTIERESTFGDLTTNVAFFLSKTLKVSSREIASQMAAELNEIDIFERVEVGGGGFLNFFLKRESLCEELREILSRADSYGSSAMGAGEKVLVEFVSANPTGPLLVVNARAAAIGDSLVRILNFSGYDTKSEYYINDAGHQVDLLVDSVISRYRELVGESSQFPEDGYRGEYVRALGREILEKRVPAESVRDYVLGRIVDGQRRTLEAFRIKFDRWVKESGIRPKVSEVKSMLREKKTVYESEGALWLMSSQFGDEKDRVLVKKNGEPTYLLPDLAYHLDKFSRGYNRLLNIWGPDHHGYIPRIKAGVEALGYAAERLQILIAQQVNLIKGGKRSTMSKREGEIITMDDLLDEVGVDVARFFFLLRRNSSHLDFDIDLARKTSEDNPVYYVQYAHARVCSILKHAEQHGIKLDEIEDFQAGQLVEDEELSLVKRLMMFPDVVERVSSSFEPHSIPYYLIDLATVFHKFYEKHRVVGDNRDLTLARLALVKATKQVIHNGLTLIGVSAPHEM